MFVEAVRWIAWTDRPWRDLPRQFGLLNSVYRRIASWSRREVWHRVFVQLAQDADFEVVFIDSMIDRAHQHTAGAPKIWGTKSSDDPEADWAPRFTPCGGGAGVDRPFPPHRAGDAGDSPQALSAFEPAGNGVLTDAALLADLAISLAAVPQLDHLRLNGRWHSVRAGFRSRRAIVEIRPRPRHRSAATSYRRCGR